MTRHWIWGLALYALLLGGGFLLGHAIGQWVHVPGGAAAPFSPMVLMVAGIYIAASALPFVPGAEIGLALMMVFGSRIAILVYLCMLMALWIAFFAGYFLPKSSIRKLFLALGLKRAAALVRRAEDMTSEERSAFLSARVKNRFLRMMLENRYLSLILLLNLPGNAVLGGGGGLCLMAGMSRLYTPLGFCLATALAVAPVPVVVMLLGYAP